MASKNEKGKPIQNHVSAECGVLLHWMREDGQFPVMVKVDTETRIVFAHAWRRTRADTVMLEALMEDIDVLGQKQMRFKSDQENPAKSVRECGTKTIDDAHKPSVSLL